MRSSASTDVAIIGMACVFPGARDLDEFWENLRAGRDAIVDAPPERIEPQFFDHAAGELDRLYCRRGGFIGETLEFDPLRWGLMPIAARGSEPDQLLSLDTAAAALTDAGYDDRETPRERTGVILGRGGYVNQVAMSLVQAVRTAEEIVRSARALLPDLTDAQAAEMKRRYQAQIEGLGPDTIIGLVPNLAASRIANRLDLHGPAYVVDAACASSLLAVDQACAELASGRCDLVLAGGVHLVQDAAFWAVFTQLGALSRSQRIRPFHRESDGLLIGEGAGMMALKRLSDAERDDDRVYAVIRGTGVSSDGRASSVMNPSADSQVLSLERAWQRAGLDPKARGSVGLIEAHGTATPNGDAAELATLERVFGPPDGSPGAGLGSVKSMIGHAMPAAGMAGMIKAALAVHYGILPPTLHCEDPHPGVERTRFRLVREAAEWESEGPRRAGVNAFGFGGINAHVVLEQHHAVRLPRTATRRHAPEGAWLRLAASTPEELAERLAGAAPDAGSGPCRLALLDPTPDRIEHARSIVAAGRTFRDRAGALMFAPRGLATEGGRLALLFPGVESTFDPQVDDVARWFGLPPLPPPIEGDLERRGARVVLAGRLLHHALTGLGVRPAMVAGHSIGEWTALLAAEAIPPRALDDVLAALRPGTLAVPEVAYAAVGCGTERLEPFLSEADDIHVALDNCPHQTVLCGPSARLGPVLDRLRADGVFCQVLSFESGFHSPVFAEYVDPIRRVVEGLEIVEPAVPVWSATTCAPYPDDPAGVRELFLEHLVQPVRFRRLTEALYAEGVRLFVQVGAGSVAAFVEDTLRGRPHLSMAASSHRHEGIDQLRRLVATLWVEGVEVDADALLGPAGTPARKSAPVRIRLGAPLLSIEEGMAPELPARPPSATGDDGLDLSDPIARELAATSRALEESHRAVLEAWRNRRTAAQESGGTAVERPATADGTTMAAGPRELAWEEEFSLARYPFLLDHSFFSLPPGWPDPGDGFPLVPFTMTLSRMMAAAERAVPGRLAVGLERVMAYRWIPVDEPRTLPVTARFDGDSRVVVRVGEHAEGTVVLADAWPDPPAPDRQPLEAARPIDQTAADMYATRLMFHGPRYQSVAELGEIGTDGIRGTIVEMPAEGALLDGAGQLLGYWIKAQSDRDRVAVPVMLEQASFYGPPPETGRTFECTVRVRRFGARQVRADLELASGRRVWARFTGWEDRRRPNEPWMWPVIQWPERNMLARPIEGAPGCVRLERAFADAITRDYFARRYLTAREWEAYRDLPERRKEDWLAGRVAAKDGVRRLLWDRGAGPLWPIEVEIPTGADGAPEVRAPGGLDLRVSISHKQGRAVAMVAEGVDPGVDLETVEARAPELERAAFTEREREWLSARPEAERDEWRARLWAAKEAAAKRRRTGMRDPRRMEIESMDEERIDVAGTLVATRIEDGCAIAWTMED
ncbi:MAG TPA: beta-ketoacyl synthase N-terminal-like domain-containing protein [Gemmatimonadota bacterium]|nr:beta-ketoacyl synthase N-terminal-like domain-containing protein [Gemmatimonadota bacterium]